MEYLLKKKKAIMSVANQNYGFLKTVSGEPPVLIENTMSANLSDYQIHGDLRQDGTPSPASPVAIESCGDYDETTGKYKIEIVTSRTKTNIYLDEPLRKLGDYADYIDFKNRRVVRRVLHSPITNITSTGVYVTSIGKAIPCMYGPWAGGRLVGTPILCTHDIQTMSAGSLSGAGYHIWAHNQQASAPYIYWGFPYTVLSNYSDTTLGKESQATELANAFNAFLASEAEKGTPVTLYWVYRYEEYETLSPPRIAVSADNDTISFGTSVNPSNVIIEYFSNTP